MRGSRRGIVADDVVIEHAADGVALLLGPFEQTIAAGEALLFAGNCGEEKRGAVCGCAARDGVGGQARACDAYVDALAGYGGDWTRQRLRVRLGLLRLGRIARGALLREGE